MVVFGMALTNRRAAFIFISMITLTIHLKAEELGLGIARCLGVCVHRNHAICTPALNRTDCGEGFVCCSANITNGDTTDFSNSSWEGTFHEINRSDSTVSSHSSSVSENGRDSFYEKLGFEAPESFGESLEASPRSPKPQFLNQAESETTGSPLSTLVYEGQTDTSSPGNKDIGEELSEIMKCPGLCMKNGYVSYCQFLILQPLLCEKGKTCCITEQEARKMLGQKQQVDEQFQKQEPNYSAVFPDLGGILQCPAQCVHTSRIMFCEEILSQFACPIDSKCCIPKRSSTAAHRIQPIVSCIGQCIPNHLLHLCFPPYNIVLGTINCNRGTTCCMSSTLVVEETPGRNHPLLSSVFQSRPQHDTSSQVDDSGIQIAERADGTLYQVDASGQMKHISELPESLLRHGPMQLFTTVNKPEGRLFIMRDSSGNLYQEYESVLGKYVLKDDMLQPSDEILESELSKDKDYSSESEDNANMEEIIIPDEDELPASKAETTTLLPKVKPTISPICPGSCISDFLRLTCFGNYATYDGFFCPGRSVCCANKKDITEHEKYLKTFSMPESTPRGLRSNAPTCGKKGIEAKDDSILPGEWCWQVAIINSQNQYICGGTIIDKLWVITAAHCVSGFLNDERMLFVRAGVADLTNEEENTIGQTRRVLATYVHQDHNSMTLDNDIALLQLQNPLELSSNVCVVCMPSNSELPPEGTVCITTGYGFISRSGTMTLKMNKAVLPLVHDMDCIANVTDALASVFILPASSFCAGGHGRKDSCQADAGGPLVCETGGVYELFGLASWGLGCGFDEVPSIFAKVPAFVGWINQIINYDIYLKAMP